jgi:hypothetical protein
MRRKFKTTIGLVFLCISISAVLHAQQNTAKTRVLIFNLKTDENAQKFLYYTIIIPKTIGTSLQKNGSVDIQNNNARPARIGDYTNKKEVKKFIDSLKNYNADPANLDYVILGSSNFDLDEKDQGKEGPKKIAIDIQIVNIKGKSAIQFSDTSTEVGAIFQQTIDNLTAKINAEISSFDSSNKVQFSSSPFMKIHNGLSKISLGLNGGYIFFVGKWRDIYNDAAIVGPYVMVTPIKWFGVSADMLYFSTDSDKKNTITNSYFEGWNYHINAHAVIPIKFFTILAGFGAGITFSTITINPMNSDSDPFKDPAFEKNSKNANINISLAFAFDVSIIHIALGGTYERIFYTNEHMQYASVYGTL